MVYSLWFSNWKAIGGPEALCRAIADEQKQRSAGAAGHSGQSRRSQLYHVNIRLIRVTCAQPEMI